mmetsp:Transcript_23816/g.52651  ORF Transcript_23816/g.52651 Transcript_23816/m.52651 type:complete len:116 (+) Transcript_23816:72-419(+)
MERGLICILFGTRRGSRTPPVSPSLSLPTCPNSRYRYHRRDDDYFDRPKTENPLPMFSPGAVSLSFSIPAVDRNSSPAQYPSDTYKNGSNGRSTREKEEACDESSPTARDEGPSS